METDPRDPSKGPPPDPDREVPDREVRDILSGFNAEEILDDPDDEEPKEKHEPAATPDSPNPI